MARTPKHLKFAELSSLRDTVAFDIAKEVVADDVKYPSSAPRMSTRLSYVKR